MRLQKFLILLTFSIVLFCGCGKKDVITQDVLDAIHEEAETDIEELNTEPVDDKLVSTSESNDSFGEYGFEFDYPVEELIWDKEQVIFGQNTISIDANWENGIYVDDVFMTAKEPSDFSSLKNYFYDRGWEELDIFTAYNERSAHTERLERSLGKLSTLNLTINTIPYNDNQIISKIELIGITNVFEGGLEELKNAANYKTGRVGIGSLYKDAVTVLGEDSGKSTTDSGMNYTTIVTYNRPSSNIILYFTHESENDLQDAVLTSIVWHPIGAIATIQNRIDTTT